MKWIFPIAFCLLLGACADPEKEANVLFVSAASNVSRALTTQDKMQAHVLLLEARQTAERIVREYPQTVVAVKISSGDMIGGLSAKSISETIHQIESSRVFCQSRPTKKCIMTIVGEIIRKMANNADSQKMYVDFFAVFRLLSIEKRALIEPHFDFIKNKLIENNGINEDDHFKYIFSKDYGGHPEIDRALYSRAHIDFFVKSATSLDRGAKNSIDTDNLSYAMHYFRHRYSIFDRNDSIQQFTDIIESMSIDVLDALVRRYEFKYGWGRVLDTADRSKIDLSIEKRWAQLPEKTKIAYLEADSRRMKATRVQELLSTVDKTKHSRILLDHVKNNIGELSDIPVENIVSILNIAFDQNPSRYREKYDVIEALIRLTKSIDRRNQLRKFRQSVFEGLPLGQDAKLSILAAQSLFDDLTENRISLSSIKDRIAGDVFLRKDVYGVCQNISAHISDDRVSLDDWLNAVDYCFSLLRTQFGVNGSVSAVQKQFAALSAVRVASRRGLDGLKRSHQRFSKHPEWMSEKDTIVRAFVRLGDVNDLRDFISSTEFSDAQIDAELNRESTTVEELVSKGFVPDAIGRRLPRVSSDTVQNRLLIDLARIDASHSIPFLLAEVTSEDRQRSWVSLALDTKTLAIIYRSIDDYRSRFAPKHAFLDKDFSNFDYNKLKVEILSVVSRRRDLTKQMAEEMLASSRGDLDFLMLSAFIFDNFD